MSHFTVLVIGDNPVEQLEPYDENIDVDDYVLGLVTEEDKQQFMEYYIDKKQDLAPGISFDDAYDLKGDEWNGMRWQKEDDGNWYEHSTYNPNSKWDWYQLGGRWTGYFKLKNGCSDGTAGQPGLGADVAQRGWVDQAFKGDIDFDFMREEEGKIAAERYDKFYAIVGDREIPVWNDVRKKYPDDQIEMAREEYWKNPVIVDLNKDTSFGSYFIFNKPESFIESRADYIQAARNSAISTFAVVKNGKWYEKGQMGWWAIVHDAKERDAWAKEFSELLDSLPDDTLLSVFDCHI